MPLPNLIIIGAQKCGTTSMHAYLGRHRQIAMSETKELDFFIDRRNWSKGVEWYAAQFSDDAAVRGESSPNYTWTRAFPGVPERMHSVVPDARLIFMVRDPIQRVISHWIHNYSNGRENRPLAEVVGDHRYYDRSLYWTQVSAFLEHYDRSRILVVAMDELQKQARETMRRVFDFVELDDDFREPVFAIQRHRSARKRRKTRTGAWIAGTRVGRRLDALPGALRWPVRELLYRPFSRRLERPELAPAEREQLAERLRDDTNRFREFAGRDFSDWNV
ncbi:MAG TPA: sulfotransferase domain-containing protein [Kofleriaceae bacterium]|nr:sulfotransferase domain-containing protein [Kofleriaceae bacterium]